jgi:hypothetical protein
MRFLCLVCNPFREFSEQRDIVPISGQRSLAPATGVPERASAKAHRNSLNLARSSLLMAYLELPSFGFRFHRRAPSRSGAGCSEWKPEGPGKKIPGWPGKTIMLRHASICQAVNSFSWVLIPAEVRD